MLFFHIVSGHSDNCRIAWEKRHCVHVIAVMVRSCVSYHMTSRLVLSGTNNAFVLVIRDDVKALSNIVMPYFRMFGRRRVSRRQVIRGGFYIEVGVNRNVNACVTNFTHVAFSVFQYPGRVCRRCHCSVVSEVAVSPRSKTIKNCINLIELGWKHSSNRRLLEVNVAIGRAAVIGGANGT